MTWENTSEWTALVFLALWAGLLIVVSVGLVRVILEWLHAISRRAYEHWYVARLKGRWI